WELARPGTEAYLEQLAKLKSRGGRKGGRILEPPPKARGNGAAVCGAPAAAARRGHAFWDHSATLGIRTCCGWSFGHSRGPVVVPRCAQPRLPRLLVEEPASGHGPQQPVRALVGPVRELNAVPELARVPRLIQTSAKRIRGQPEHR